MPDEKIEGTHDPTQGGLSGNTLEKAKKNKENNSKIKELLKVNHFTVNI